MCAAPTEYWSQVNMSRVTAMSLSRFVLEEIGGRRLPSDPASTSRVLMKMDIEGAETEVISDLVLSGAIQHIDKVSHLRINEFLAVKRQ